MTQRRTMERVAITGVGLVSPLGDSLESLSAALLAGESGLGPLELFPLPNGVAASIRVGEIRDFEPERYLGERNLRPLDRTSRLLCAAASRAFDDAQLDNEQRFGLDVGLVVGTTYCSLRTIAEFDRRGQKLGPGYASPLDFANSVINAAAGQAAIWFGLTGVNATISSAEASGLQAIAYAADLVASGQVDAVLAGGAEELAPESFLAYARAGRIGAERPIPFDAARDGFAPAEGAAFVVLESERSARARGARIYGFVLGHGVASGDGSVERAVRVALDDAHVSAEALSFVMSGASGSRAGDAAEAHGLARVLGDGATLPIAAIKSLLGEALGASGGLQVAATLGAFVRGEIAGVLGLGECDQEISLAGVTAQAQTISSNGHGMVALVTALAADGPAVALVLESSEGHRS